MSSDLAEAPARFTILDSIVQEIEIGAAKLAERDRGQWETIGRNLKAQVEALREVFMDCRVDEIAKLFRE